MGVSFWQARFVGASTYRRCTMKQTALTEQELRSVKISRNWGLLVDNKDNKPLCLHKLMDFNQSFQAYDTLDGGNCQTLFWESQPMTQKEALKPR